VQVLAEDEPRRRPQTLTSVASNAMYFLAIGFFGFLAGTYVMFSDTFPAGCFADAYRGCHAHFAKHTQYDHAYPRELRQPALPRARDVKVSRDGELVWEYINPEAQEYIPVVSWGQRIEAKTLEPGFVEGLEQKESLG
jgi:hypothetical protein